MKVLLQRMLGWPWRWYALGAVGVAIVAVVAVMRVRDTPAPRAPAPAVTPLTSADGKVVHRQMAPDEIRAWDVCLAKAPADVAARFRHNQATWDEITRMNACVQDERERAAIAGVHFKVLRDK